LNPDCKRKSRFISQLFIELGSQPAFSKRKRLNCGHGGLSEGDLPAKYSGKN
jgi:hypothetical protein